MLSKSHQTNNTYAEVKKFKLLKHSVVSNTEYVISVNTLGQESQICTTLWS